MDQATLVDMQIEDGRRLVERLVGAGVPVTVAAWVKESESGWWYLYLVTPLVVGDGVPAGLGVGTNRTTYDDIEANILPVRLPIVEVKLSRCGCIEGTSVEPVN